MRLMQRVLVVGLCALLFGFLAQAVFHLPDAPVRLAAQVQENMDVSGVKHPVTAVLLNFRGYDTLLEIAVLLLAVLGVLTAAGGERSASFRVSGSPQPLLQSMAGLLAPVMVLVAGYLLWAGSHRPGGAFQAGAVLAAGLVLLYLSGLLPAWPSPGRRLRLGLTVGFLVFVAVAIAALPYGRLLQYPKEFAGGQILLIEAGLTISLGLILAGLFLWLPNENEEAEE